MVAKVPRGAFAKLLASEAKLARRSPSGLIFGLAVPVGLLIVLGLTTGGSQAGGASYFTAVYPMLLGMSTLMLGVNVLPRVLVTYREMGVLRRLATTPIPPSWLLAAQVVICLGLSVVTQIIMMVVGTRKFGLNMPNDWIGFLVADVLTVTSLFAIGLCIAALIRNSALANIMNSVVLWAFMYFGGLWGPLGSMSNVSKWTPIGSSVTAIQDALQGAPMNLQSLLCLVLYTGVFGFLSARFFRWE